MDMLPTGDIVLHVVWDARPIKTQRSVLKCRAFMTNRSLVQSSQVSQALNLAGTQRSLRNGPQMAGRAPFLLLRCGAAAAAGGEWRRRRCGAAGSALRLGQRTASH